MRVLIQEMEGIGWKPLDLMVGGFLTAGVAFGVYKLGANRKVVGVGELEASALQECLALAGRPSEMEVSVLPQSDPNTRRLAESLAKSIKASYSASDGAIIRYGPEDVARMNQGEVMTLRRTMPQSRQQSKDLDRDGAKLFHDNDAMARTPDRSPPRRRRGSSSFGLDSYSGSPAMYRTPPELTRQLKSYREKLEKLTADSEAKQEKLEQQRMALATELHVTREALQAERRHRAEAEQRRHKAETQLKDLEARMQQCTETRTETTRREEKVKLLEQQLRELEEQLENIYLHNVVTPRHTVQDNVKQQHEVSLSLQEAQDRLQQQQQDLQDLENDIQNMSEQLNKARKDARQLGEDNAALQKQLHGAQHAARDMVALLYERSAGSEANASNELTELLNAPDAELPLDKLLQCVSALLMHT